MRNYLYIGNLPPASQEELVRLFSPFGVVRYAALHAGGGTPGVHFGVVEMQAGDEAEAAMEALDGSEVGGRRVEVRWATPPEQTACGHPAMFGAMNVCDGGQPGDGAAPPADRPAAARPSDRQAGAALRLGMNTEAATRAVLDRLARRPAGGSLPATRVKLRNGGSFDGVLTGHDTEYGPAGRYGRAVFTDLNGNILRHIPLDQILDF